MEVLKTKNKICVCCGRVLINVKCNVKYCDECRGLIKNGNIDRIITKENQLKEKPRTVVKHSFAEVIKLAQEAGMSYGKYCLKYGI